VERTADWLARAEESRRLDDEAAVRQCLERAAACAAQATDWLSCARLAWDLGWESDQLRYLDAAEAMASATVEWLGCADLRRRFGDAPTMYRDLAHAKARAADAPDWMRLAEVWQHFHLEEARKCLDQAEVKATRTDDWLFAARFRAQGDWIIGRAEKYGEEAEELGRSIAACMARAEASAKGPGDWVACAWAWASLNDVDGTNAADSLFSRVTRSIIPDNSALRRCMDKAAACEHSPSELEKHATERLKVVGDKSPNETWRLLIELASRDW
jgi:hypothetical protein